MPNIGPVELVIILVIALLVIGPGKLPDVGAALGKSIREFRKAATDVQESVKLDAPATPTPAAPAPVSPVVPAAVVPAPAAQAPAPGCAGGGRRDGRPRSRRAGRRRGDRGERLALVDSNARMADADLVRDGVGGLAPPVPSGPPPAAAAGDEASVMSLVDHLSELRRRIAISLLAVGIGSVVGFSFAPQLITFLKAPLNLAKPLVYTGPGRRLLHQPQARDRVGIVLAMPVLVWQLWRVHLARA